MNNNKDLVKNIIFDYANMYKAISTLTVLAILENDFKTIENHYNDLKNLQFKINSILKEVCTEKELKDIEEERFDNMAEYLMPLKIVATYNKILSLKYSNMDFKKLEKQLFINKMSIDLYDLEDFSYINIANILYDNGKYEEVLELCKFIKEISNSAPIWEILGKTYRKLGRYGEAVEAYRKYLELNEKDTDAIECLNEIYEEALI